MSNRASVSCVIPAFNEARWIAPVLALVADHPLISQVIVVDDASDDDTGEIAKRIAAGSPRITVIRHSKNLGKTKAVVTGIGAATEEYLLLLDGDLVGLKPESLTDLVTPVVTGQADASVSLIGDTPLFRRIIGVDYISGQRVMRREFLAEHTDKLRELPRFGLEVFINEMWLERDYRIAVVRWPDVANPAKKTKWGRGILPEITMSKDILKVVPLHRILPQILALRARRV